MLVLTRCDEFMTEYATGLKSRLCSVFAKAAGDDPAGTATSFGSYLAVEIGLPWREDVAVSTRFPKGLWPAIQDAWGTGIIGSFTALAPDQEYSRDGHVRLMYLKRPVEPFAAYEKYEWLMPAGETVQFVRALVAGDLSRFERYREKTADVRDLLVCTHGSMDACCGKFGYPLYNLLRFRYAGPNLRVWRTSHIGGHRYAPTLIDFPEGRYWGHAELDAVETLLLRNRPVEELRRFYRGWAGLESVFEQVAEREIFIREGWAWTRYLKAGRILERTGEKSANVRIEYASPDGLVSGAYDAIVENCESVTTMHRSGEGTVEAPQYRVARLEKVS